MSERRTRALWSTALAVAAVLVVLLAFWTIGTMLEVRDLRGAVAQRAGWLGELERSHAGDHTVTRGDAELCGLVREIRAAPDLTEPTVEALDRLEPEACGDAETGAATDPDVSPLIGSIRGELGSISVRLGELWDGFYLLSWIALVLAGTSLALLAYLRVIRLRQISDHVEKLERHMGDADRLAVVGTLAAGAAHEINNPLALILGNLQLVAMRIDREPDMHEERESLAQASDAVRRISGIVRDLQEAGRPIPERIEPCDLWSCIERSLALAALDFPASLQVERELEPVPKALAPAPRLEQVLLNLFVNASHAIRQHQPDQPRLTIRCQEEADGRVSLEIEDNGPGFAPEVLQRAFEPFVTTKPSGQGTGLGLYVCHRLLASFDASISLQNTGSGALIRIDLPTERSA